jgi:hypothetical protein
MEKQPIRQSSGAKAVALDARTLMLRYRLQLLALLLSAAFALGLHLIFGR